MIEGVSGLGTRGVNVLCAFKGEEEAIKEELTETPAAVVVEEAGRTSPERGVRPGWFCVRIP